MALLKPMDFGFFYAPYDPADPVKHPGQLHGTTGPMTGPSAPSRAGEHRAADRQLHRHRARPASARALLPHLPHLAAGTSVRSRGKCR